MASDRQQGDDALNLDRLRQLAQLMDEHNLSEIDVRHQGERIRLRRGVAAAAPAQGAISHLATPPIMPIPGGERVAATPEPATADGVVLIKSPMVGTFYTRANPESEPYVKVGDHVGPETIVCIIEAMKVFNEIPAEVSGRVIGILVENEEPVEYGKPLFKVDTRG
jgi:acetyl-CoA carboxylase biotin carboxyl carrier protein